MRYSTNDDEVVSRMIRPCKNIISYLYDLPMREKKDDDDERLLSHRVNGRRVAISRYYDKNIDLCERTISAVKIYVLSA